MTTKQMASLNGNVANGNNSDVQSIIEGAMQTVEDVMHNVVNSDVDVLQSASHHILAAGGKRVRPRLLMLSYLATGGTNIDHAAPVAAALELVHTASVVHDDINDHGVLRRGRPSVNAIWGRTFALLTGDYLFTKVYELMAGYGDLNVLFSEATIALVEGETLQAAAVKNKQFDRETYMKIIARKTAVLFKIGAMLGGRLNNASEKQLNALEQYGYNIGLAFQIIDDILDIVGDEKELGKTSGIDLDQGKGFASVEDSGNGNGHGHSNGHTNGNGNGNGNGTPADPMAEIKRKLISADRIDRAQDQAHSLVQMAIKDLDVLPDTPYREALIDLAYSVINRTK